MDIYYTSKFKKSFQKLPNDIMTLAAEKEKIFRNDMFHPSLRTHKLKGKLSFLYSFSINYEYRIIFEIDNKNTVYFINVGTHSIYK